MRSDFRGRKVPHQHFKFCCVLVCCSAQLFMTLLVCLRNIIHTMRTVLAVSFCLLLVAALCNAEYKSARLEVGNLLTHKFFFFYV